MTHEQIKDAIIDLRHDALWTLHGDDLSGLNWLDENQSRPTDEEILAKIEELSNI